MRGELMAKRNETTTASDKPTRPTAPPDADTVEQRLVAFAEQLGRIVGTVQARADGWLDRRSLNDDLRRIRDGAADLLNHVGGEAAPASIAATPGQRQTGGDAPGRPAAAPTGWQATTAAGRGKVDAPGKSHRKPQPGVRGIKHSDETIPKLKAAQATRRRRHG
jgi:hypothetical protein